MLYLKCLVAALALSLAQADNTTGGWTDASVTDVQKLYQTAALVESNFASASFPRVCATKFISAQQQVVAGMNYRLNVTGCALAGEKTVAANCACTGTPTPYTITLFEPLGKSNVTITQVVASDSTSTSTDTNKAGAFSNPHAATDEEKALFVKATGANANYTSENAAHVCATTYLTVAQQVVAGTNYQFTIQGCPVTGAPPATCSCNSPSNYQVTIFSGLDGTTQVTSSVQSNSTSTTGTTTTGSNSTTTTTGSPVTATGAPGTTTAVPKAASNAATSTLAIASVAVAAAVYMN
ncbi:hypothetical protein THRCLA_21692 [Thraustotheca clavata]|uniref:Secreted protein n=1 Tax=Thraustotheca clavata TaxID=74557 RepID=A0A1V9ZQU2_9STRA|nr:hypothetical protein THRCLA_21692 [Thraustotheca clavata]